MALIEQDTEVLITVINIEKTRPGGASFSFLNRTMYDLSKYGILKSVDKNKYHHNCLISHWKQEGYQISSYRN